MSGAPQSSLPPVPPRLDLIPPRPLNSSGASSPGVTSKVTGIYCEYKDVVYWPTSIQMSSDRLMSVPTG